MWKEVQKGDYLLQLYLSTIEALRWSSQSSKQETNMLKGKKNTKKKQKKNTQIKTQICSHGTNFLMVYKMSNLMKRILKISSFYVTGKGYKFASIH